MVALTIDDSPDPETTSDILSVLRSHKAPATFFITGDHAKEGSDILDCIAKDRHDLGNHLMRDYAAIRLSRDEFERDFLACEDILRPFGLPRFFRPPSAIYRRSMLDFAAKWGYRSVLGDAFPIDTHISHQPLRRAILRWLIKPGSIIVLHDRGARGRRTTETLLWLLPWLDGEGLEPVSLDRLLDEERAAPHDVKGQTPSDSWSA